MRLFHTLFGFLSPRAHAVTLDTAGAGAPGVDEMWSQYICNLFPWGCDFPAPGGGTSSNPVDAVFFFTDRSRGVVGSILGAVAVAMVLYAAIKMIVSQGQEEGRNEAKKILMYALGGVALYIIAAAVIRFFELMAVLWLD